MKVETKIRTDRCTFSSVSGTNVRVIVDVIVDGEVVASPVVLSGSEKLIGDLDPEKDPLSSYVERLGF